MIVFDNINDCIDCKGELKHHHEKCYVQTKAHEREKIRISDSNNNSDEHVETNENYDSSVEVDVDSRFNFERTVPDETPMQNQNMPEHEKRSADCIAAKTEFYRVSVNCIECKVKWKKSHTKNELNWEQNDKNIDTHKHLWGVNMKVLLDHLIQESSQERQFRCLPEM